jgi:small subunit ribosomal protein S1
MDDQEALPFTQGMTGVNPMDTLPMDAFDVPQLRVGETKGGTIVSIGPTEILVNIGSKSDAIVDPRELERLDRSFLDDLNVGDSVTVYVLQTETRDGAYPVVSLSRAQQEQDWRQAEELLQSQDVFEGVVTGYNRGGVLVRVGRVRGFVPASQLSLQWQALQDAEGEPDERWARLVGQKMQLKVLEIDRQRNRLILSERLAMRDWRKGQKDRLLTQLRKGDVVQGVVTSIAPFGAFVDLGGADGLIHLSELAWHRVDHPGEVLRAGQHVDVYVMNVDEDRKRIALSLRRLTPEPWSTVDQNYAVGQVVSATITKLTNFGAFAKIDDAIEGLIHISELVDYRIGHPKEVVQEGDEVRVRIIRIDPERRRVGLSLRQASDEAYVEVDWREEARAGIKEDAGDELGNRQFQTALESFRDEELG